jgi:hypothetical protein
MRHALIHIVAVDALPQYLNGSKPIACDHWNAGRLCSSSRINVVFDMDWYSSASEIMRYSLQCNLHSKNIRSSS